VGGGVLGFLLSLQYDEQAGKSEKAGRNGKNQHENGAAAGRRHDNVSGFPLSPQGGA